MSPSLFNTIYTEYHQSSIYSAKFEVPGDKLYKIEVRSRHALFVQYGDGPSMKTDQWYWAVSVASSPVNYSSIVGWSTLHDGYEDFRERAGQEALLALADETGLDVSAISRTIISENTMKALAKIGAPNA